MCFHGFSEGSEVETERTRGQEAIGVTPLSFFQAQFRLSRLQYALDPNTKKLYDDENEYGNQIGGDVAGTKLMKIANGFYDSPASLGKYLEKEFSRGLPIKGHEERSACQIHSSMTI